MEVFLVGKEIMVDYRIVRGGVIEGKFSEGSEKLIE